MRLAYVLDRFPVLSETFIAREIEGLAHEGIRPELFALRRGEEAAEGAADGADRRTPAAEVLPGAFSARVLSARLAWFIKSPLCTLDSLTKLVAGTSRSPRTGLLTRRTFAESLSVRSTGPGVRPRSPASRSASSPGRLRPA